MRSRLIMSNSHWDWHYNLNMYIWLTLDPEDLSPSQLISFMRYLKEYSQVPKPMNWHSGKKVTSPFALITLVLIACSFYFGPLRQQSMGFRLVIALFTGLGFSIYRIFGVMPVRSMPPSQRGLSLPILLMFVAGSYLLYRFRCTLEV